MVEEDNQSGDEILRSSEYVSLHSDESESRKNVGGFTETMQRAML